MENFQKQTTMGGNAHPHFALISSEILPGIIHTLSPEKINKYWSNMLFVCFVLFLIESPLGLVFSHLVKDVSLEEKRKANTLLDFLFSNS